MKVLNNVSVFFVLATLGAWAGEPVKGKDCPDFEVLTKTLNSLDQEQMTTALTNLQRVKSGKLSGLEALYISNEFLRRNDQPNIKYSKSKVTQVGCKMISGESEASAGSSSSSFANVPFKKFTKDSVTIDFPTLDPEFPLMELTMRVRGDRMELTTDSFAPFSVGCQGGTNTIAEKIRTVRHSVFAWTTKKGSKTPQFQTAPEFAELAKQADPIAKEFSARCNRMPLLDGGVTLPKSEGGVRMDDSTNSGADAGSTIAN